MNFDFGKNLKRICKQRGTSPTKVVTGLGFTTIRCKSEPLLLREAHVWICERNRGHGMSRDLFLVIRFYCILPC